MSERPALRALAEREGILAGYQSALDGSFVETSDATREALLRAMGVEAGSEAAAKRVLAERDAEAAAQILEPVVVAVHGRPEARRLAVRAEPGATVDGMIASEDSENLPFGGPVDEAGGFELPELATGRYRLRVRIRQRREHTEKLQYRIVVPERCVSVEERLGAEAGFGIWANLYSLRSPANLGFGNLADLSKLVELAAREGAAFVGLNPLHALSPGSVCPYQPLSRLFRHPQYLDPYAIPELPHCPEARALENDAFRARLAALGEGAQLDAPGVARALAELLAPLHRCFTQGACGPERTRAFERFRKEQGSALQEFALFTALADHFEAQGGTRTRDWRHWPEPFRSPAGADAQAFARSHPEEIARASWVQFELERQLGEVAGRARRSGMALGLYTDLALGSDPGGFDSWAYPQLLASGAEVGAPPDAFSRQGQAWGLPPPRPRALRREGYDLWVRVLRASFRHAGALRLDHAMGMERLFWIPEGRPASEGAYVRYPRDEMLGIVALESQRQGAVVIAEDLGTLPEGFADSLAERSILSSRVMLFEREGEAFRPAEQYPSRCLLTANTHDLPPLAALLGSEDLALRRRAGQLADDDALAQARAERETDRAALLQRLRADGYLPESQSQSESDSEAGAELAAAVTRFLCATPAALVGLSLDDLAAEREPINLPGVPPERHPSWIRRMARPLEALWSGPTARAALSAVPAHRKGNAQRAS